MCTMFILSDLYRPSVFNPPPPPFQRAYAQAAKSVTVYRISELTVKFVLYRSEKKKDLLRRKMDVSVWTGFIWLR